MAARILVFGDVEVTGNLYSLYLRSKGYEVLYFPSPATCALVTQQKCTCPRSHVCADVFLADMVMAGMTGLELIRHQREKGCHALPQHKAVLSTGLNYKQEQEIRALGCMSLCKPFRLMDLLAWVSACVKNIPPDRKLIPYNELFDTAQFSHRMDQAT